MNKTALIQLNQLAFRYPDGTEALRNVTLDVRKGERVALLGNNGAGKSTIFLILNGIYKPQAGQYLYEGVAQEYSKQALWNLRKKVGVIFQDPDNQLFAPTVYEEISFGPLNLKLSTEEVKLRVAEAMQWLDIEDLQHKPPHLLSYGQKKRVAIASVLAMHPEVLVLDEPSSGLDPEHATHISKILDKLHQSGTTIILSTHDVDFAYAWADSVVLMHNGKVKKQASAEEVFANDELITRCGLSTPTTKRIFKQLEERFGSNASPRSVNELIDIINSL